MLHYHCHLAPVLPPPAVGGDFGRSVRLPWGLGAWGAVALTGDGGHAFSWGDMGVEPAAALAVGRCFERLSCRSTAGWPGSAGSDTSLVASPSTDFSSFTSPLPGGQTDEWVRK